MKFHCEEKPILWGGATASSQYEGGWDKGGKGMDTQDCRPYLIRTSNATTETRLLTKKSVSESKKDKLKFYPFRSGSDGYNHLKEDIQLLKELGIDIYRLSISWARLYPNGDEEEPNIDGIRYYDEVFSEIKKSGMKIFLTMTHYALPLYLVEHYGGWTNRKLIEFYIRFAKTIFEKWGDVIDYYLPFNEINAGYFSPYNGVGLLREENKPYNQSLVFQSLHHQFVASAKVIELGHKLVKGKFGCMVACFCYYPYSCNPLDNMKLVTDENTNTWFCADVLTRGYYPNYMTRFFEERNIEFEVTEEDERVLRENTADFVSFSYYQSSVTSYEEKAVTELYKKMAQGEYYASHRAARAIGLWLWDARHRFEHSQSDIEAVRALREAKVDVGYTESDDRTLLRLLEKTRKGVEVGQAVAINKQSGKRSPSDKR